MDHNLADRVDGHPVSELLTPLEYTSFLTNHLNHLLHQRELLEHEILRVREFLARAGMMQRTESQPLSLPALLLQLTRQPWEDGLPLVRQKRDWYFVLRALAECGILHKDGYTPLLSLLQKASIPQSLMPVRSLLCHTAADFGQFKTPVSEWQQRGQRAGDFRRRKDLALAVLHNLET